MTFRILTAAAVAGLLSLAAIPAAHAQRSGGPASVIDPACLANVPWAVNPAESDLQLNGCRRPRLVPAPDAEGWRTFRTPEGATIEVNRDAVWDPKTHGVTFHLRYNGGGSLTFVYTISGGPVMGGRLKAGTFTVQ